jgi:hypothetical protein
MGLIAWLPCLVVLLVAVPALPPGPARGNRFDSGYGDRYYGRRNRGGGSGCAQYGDGRGNHRQYHQGRLLHAVGASRGTIHGNGNGNHTVLVQYTQQTNYAAATPRSETFTVTPALVTLSLTPSSW